MPKMVKTHGVKSFRDRVENITISNWLGCQTFGYMISGQLGAVATSERFDIGPNEYGRDLKPMAVFD